MMEATKAKAAKSEPMTRIPYVGSFGATVTRIIVEYGPLQSRIIGDPESIALICSHDDRPPQARDAQETQSKE